MTARSFVPSQTESVRTIVSEGVKDAATRISTAIDEGRRPGQPLDLLARATRQAPLGALLIAFVVGAIVARRR